MGIGLGNFISPYTFQPAALVGSVSLYNQTPTADGVILTWTYGSGFTSSSVLNILVSSTLGGTYTQSGTSTTLGAPSFTVTGLTSGTTYYFKFQVVSPAYVSPSGISFTTLQSGIVTITDVSSTGLVSWTYSGFTVSSSALNFLVTTSSGGTYTVNGSGTYLGSLNAYQLTGLSSSGFVKAQLVADSYNAGYTSAPTQFVTYSITNVTYQTIYLNNFWYITGTFNTNPMTVNGETVTVTAQMSTYGNGTDSLVTNGVGSFTIGIDFNTDTLNSLVFSKNTNTIQTLNVNRPVYSFGSLNAPTLNSRTTTSVTLGLSASQSYTNQTVSVYQSTSQNSGFVAATTGTIGTSVQVTGLSSGVTYYFYISDAYNTSGVLTTLTVPTLTFTSSSLTSSGFSASWTRLPTSQGILLKVSPALSAVPTGSGLNTTLSTVNTIYSTAGGTSLTNITGFTSGVTYTILANFASPTLASAFGSDLNLGTFAVPASISVTTAGALSASGAYTVSWSTVPANSQIVITWSPARATAPSVGGNITAASTTSATISGAASTISIPGFTSGTTYTFTANLGPGVVGYNSGYSVGFGTSLSYASATPVEYPPSSLAAGTITVVSATTALPVINSVISGQAYGNGTYVISASESYAYPTYSPIGAFDKALGSAGDGFAATWLPKTTAYSGGTYSDGTYSINGYLGEWIQLKLPSAITLTSYSHTARPDGTGNLVDFKVFGSNNGTSWTLIDTQTGLTSGWVNSVQRVFSTSSNSTAYQYYNCTINKCSGSYPVVAEWRLFGY